MKIGLFGNKSSEQIITDIQILISELEKFNIDIFICPDLYDAIKKHAFFQKEPSIICTTNIQNIDFLISLGGDGTLLRTISLVRNSQIPILGINMGHLGFLTTIGKDKITHFIEQLLAKEYSIEPRSLLRLESDLNLYGNLNFALNELSVHSENLFSLLSTDVYVDNEYLATYVGDGLIIATPTGSTAYSLSCGGPILAPNSNSFVITPIAAHTLTLRPIIIPDTSVIKLKFNKNSENVYTSLDSQKQLISQNTELILKKEDFTINLVRMYGQSFFSTIREKLRWGS